MADYDSMSRKLALQKRSERQDAFLSAQKQLLKTTEYIAQLDHLSHRLTEDIRETFNLLGNQPTDSTRHFSTDINAFDPRRDSNKENKENNVPSPLQSGPSHKYDEYDINALIDTFDAINSGEGMFNESHLMSHIDAPFLSLYQDLPLFMDKIQCSLYSSCIYTKHKKHSVAMMDEIEYETEYKSDRITTALTAAQYSSYLSAREVLIEKLLQFMLRYPSLSTPSSKSEGSHSLESDASKYSAKSNGSRCSKQMESYYEEIVPFCLSALMVIECQSALYVERQGTNQDIDRQDLFKLFSEFVTKSRSDIKHQIVESLQFVNDRPSLLIECLNRYIELLRSDTFPVALEWTKLFRSFYDIETHKKGRANRGSSNVENKEFTDFLSDYLYHSAFMECFQSISETVCDSLATDFELLFAKLSTRSAPKEERNESIKPIKATKVMVDDDGKEMDQNEESKEKEDEKSEASFNEIMASIQQNLSAILTFDHHRSLLHYKSLSRYLDRSVTPQIEQSTTTVIHRFISRLTTHLTDTDNAYKHSTSRSFSLDEEYLEIGICCETLESFIRTVIDKYCSTDNAEENTPISRCLEEMISSISSLKMRALEFWSTAMSTKLFGDIGRHLERKVSFWRMYESYYTKTVWRSIVVTTDDEDEDADIAELSINIPCQPSEYIHDLCFQFIQILLMIITQEHVPKSIVGVLEKQFRTSTSVELNRVFKRFLESHSYGAPAADDEDDDDGISESLGLQFYFDVSFAAAILTTTTSQPLWDEVLSMISDRFIEMVTMEYGSKYLQSEIRKAVHGTLLMYGVHSSSYSRYNRRSSSGDVGGGGGGGDNGGGSKKKGKSPSPTVKSGGGNIFARPPNKMPRIALLPVASYQISQSALDNEKDHALSGRGNVSGLLSGSLKSNESETSKAAITQSLSELKTGAMAHANTLLKGFGSMFQ